MKLIIGIITYEELTARYLPFFLKSLKEQSYKEFELLVFNNSESGNEKNIEKVKQFFPEVNAQGIGRNLGFARAYNFLIREAFDKGAEYFLAINNDTILEPDSIEKMIAELDKDSKLGSVCPKIRHWDFKNNKKSIYIDTCGIVLQKGLRFFDLGQGDVDNGQYDNMPILGPSGAAAMYRLSALSKVIYNNQIFDELMFMYKEDCDLAYRLHIAGFASKCVSNSIIYHDRTAAGKGDGNMEVALNRRNKSRKVKEWSFLNQHIIFYKFWHLQKLSDKLAIIWYETKMLVYIFLFERYLFKQLQEFRRLKKVIDRQ